MQYILDWIAIQSTTRGLKTKFAKAIKCEGPYLSRILNKDTHLSNEQAYCAAKFFNFSDEEINYFFTLVQYARAGSHELKSYLKTKIDFQKQKNIELSARMKLKTVLSAEAQQVYYSSWIYMAIHSLLAIDYFQDRNRLAKYLDLELEKVDETIAYLLKYGLVSKDGDRFIILETKTHLSPDSHWLVNHHVNWRLKSIEVMHKRLKKNLHYTSVITISKKDEPLLKDVLLKAISEVKELTRQSGSEKAFSFCLDFFDI